MKRSKDDIIAQILSVCSEGGNAIVASVGQNDCI